MGLPTEFTVINECKSPTTLCTVTISITAKEDSMSYIKAVPGAFKADTFSVLSNGDLVISFLCNIPAYDVLRSNDIVEYSSVSAVAWGELQSMLMLNAPVLSTWATKWLPEEFATAARCAFIHYLVVDMCLSLDIPGEHTALPLIGFDGTPECLKCLMDYVGSTDAGVYTYWDKHKDNYTYYLSKLSNSNLRKLVYNPGIQCYHDYLSAVDKLCKNSGFTLNEADTDTLTYLQAV